DQIKLGDAHQAPVDAADDHQGESEGVERFHGISTLSMTWMTPLLAAMSLLVMRAPSTVSAPPLAWNSMASPLAVSAVSRPAASAAMTRPGTTWEARTAISFSRCSGCSRD